MPDENEPLREGIANGRESVANFGAALVDYLGAVQQVTERASQAGSAYQDVVALADTELSAEIGESLRESVTRFANGSLAMATAFTQIMRMMKEAYDRIESSIPED